MKIYTKRKLIDKLVTLSKMGWIQNGRFGNHGGIGNTLEDYLGITENNLPIPNASEWELKAQRAYSTSPITLFHMEPSPRAIRFVPKVFLPIYGWVHKEAGHKHELTEKRFSLTIHGKSYSDRGFIVVVDRTQRKVLISFNYRKVSNGHEEWLADIERKVGLHELDPQPYWGFDDLEHKAGTKLLNCFYVQAEVKLVKSREFYWFNKIQMLERFEINRLLGAIERGLAYVDFDARTGHNHGTKFRLKNGYLSILYKKVTPIV